MAARTGTRVALPAPKVVRSGDVARPGRAPRARGPAAAEPRFLALLAQVQRNVRRQKAHPAAQQLAAEAQAAARPPRNERTAGAKADQVDAMQEAKPGAVQTSGFLALLRAEIEKAMPKTLDDSQRLLPDGERRRVAEAARAGVGRSKTDATAAVADAANAPPDPSGVPERAPMPVPGEPAVAVQPLTAANAVPLPKTAAAISQQPKADSARDQLQKAEVTENQLARANEPAFTAVTHARVEVNVRVAAAPGQYRAAEGPALVSGVAQARQLAHKGLAAMGGGRLQAQVRVKSRQQLARELDERRRQAVTDRIEAIYQATRTRVEASLTSLETDVMAAFEEGMTSALAAMKAWADREIAAFKDDRYSGARGKLRWFRDLFRECPEGIKAILRVAKGKFAADMDALAVRLSATVDARLAEAKAEIQHGQKEIAGYVASLPRDLQGVGRSAQADVQARFAELEDGVENKKHELAAGLAQKFKAADDKANAELAAIEAANAGALKRFVDKLAAIVKVIAEFKGKLMAALRKGWAVVKAILADPIGFLGNLLAAVKGGIQAFVANFEKWLLSGLAKWLFGNLASAGVTMPRDLSPESVFTLAMQLLGITWVNIRQLAVRRLGEPVVKALEGMAEFVRIFVAGGPGALWAHVKEQLAELESMVVDAIVDWVKSTIVKQATTKLLSMFNPAGAFVQACIAIYNLVMFLIERASQILAFVEAVLGSVSAIAAGAIGSAVAWIERSLGAMVPLVISFLARLIGLGGISERVVAIVKRVQARILRAIDHALGKVVTALKQLAARAATAVRGKDVRSPEEKQRDLRAAIAEVNGMLVEPPPPMLLKARLLMVRQRYRLVRLEPRIAVDDGNLQRYDVVAEVNPLLTSRQAERMAKIARQPIAVDPPFKIKEASGEEAALDATEFRRQIKEQQTTINLMRVADWLQNRGRFKRLQKSRGSGRTAQSARAQKQLNRDELERQREAVLRSRKAIYRRNGVDVDRAVAMAVRLADKLFTKRGMHFENEVLLDRHGDQEYGLVRNPLFGLVAAHRLDQIAGGFDDLVEMGGDRVDYSIGAQWRGRRIDGLTSAVKSHAKVVKETKTLDRVVMNVKLPIDG